VKLFHSESVAETSKEERNEARSEENTPNVENFLDGLARGECKGIKGATVFKLLDYARENGYITADIETEESNG
jgi:hypothetical protein